MFERVTDNIFQVGGSNLSNISDAAVYLIRSGKTAALVDAGTGRAKDKIIENITATGIALTDIGYLFLTHCHYDHTGGADELRRASGCRIVCHELDAIYLETGDQDVTAASWYRDSISPFSIDIKLSCYESEFQLDEMELRYFHIPGHSPGSAALTALSDGMIVLFGQDVHGPLNDSLLSNRADYVRSLEYLASLNADILCEGHFGVIRGKDEVRDFIESCI